MDNSFYKMFNCRNKEELYSKIKKNDPITKDLIDFYKYKNRKFIKRLCLDSPEKVVELYSGFDKDINKMQVVFLNIKLQPIFIKEYKDVQEKVKDELIKEILKDKYLNLASKFIIFSNSDEYYNDLSNFDISKFEKHGLLDCFIYNYQSLSNDTYYSMKSSKVIKIADNNKKCNINDYCLEKNNELINLEFQEFFSRSENLNLNIIKDLNKIKKNLKIGFEDLDYEIIGIITIDKRYNIVDQQIINIGNTDTSLIDENRIMKKLIEDQKIDKWVLFHNHPSGNSEASLQDLNLTYEMIEISKDIGYDLTDHFIIAKEKVLSFVDESFNSNKYDLNFKDSRYINSRQKAHDIKKNKSR